MSKLTSKKPTQQHHNITVDSVTAMYLADREAARDSKQFASAIAAVTGIAKLHGLLTDKVQHNHQTLEEQRERANQVLRSAGIDPETIKVKSQH